MAKHTQGPWRLEEGYIVAGIEETYKCIVTPQLNHSMGRYESEANMRLLHASPDLARALAKALTLKSIPWYDGARQEMEGALYKATGMTAREYLKSL